MTFSSVPKKPKRPKQSPAIYELRITLQDVKPAIWRSFRFPADAALSDLHYVLQTVMGWTNSHLHAFEHEGDRYVEPGPDFEMDGADIDTDDVTVGELLRKAGDDLMYEYDFGDGWSHMVTLTAIHCDDGPEVWCIDGKRACPPDDCGGPGGYANLLGILVLLCYKYQGPQLAHRRCCMIKRMSSCLMVRMDVGERR